MRGYSPLTITRNEVYIMEIDYENLVKETQNNNILSGLKITLDTRLLNNEDCDFFHYEQSYELAKCDYGTFYIASRGELKCNYTDTKENIDTWNYNDIINYYVRNNTELFKAINENKIYFDMNNWFSIEFIDNNNNYLEVFDYLDNVYGSISECLICFKTDILNNEEIIKAIKESGC